ncbi:DUF4359 domain-containing protein [Halobacillus salinarum]|uniref:DUF4359 domain-containing protein n=1 Tax=Halobacillus salinarum TaxID=2932257 RepID=A0ABY4EHI6_9BACI|nr:DUF4359 domain-containing protein [Halobacillus salinarum]UOQ43928.1 DUF4359 domain-containing protein [Halobacillus salinarum]
MKKRIIMAAIILVLIVSMASTVPGKEQYVDWAVDQARERIGGDNPFLGAGIELAGPQIISNHTEESYYFVCKVYKTEIMGKQVKVIGIFHSFIPVSKNG